MIKWQEEKLEQVLKDGYPLSAVKCLEEGLGLYASHFRLFASYVLIVVGVGLISSMLWPSFFQIILYSLLLSPVFAAGYFLAADRIVMKEPLALNDFFEGFSRPFGLVLSNVIFWLIMVVLFTPSYFTLQEAGIIDWYAENINDPKALANPPEIASQASTILSLNLIPVIYLVIAYAWAYPLILFFKMPAWSALEWSRRLITKRWWPILLLHFTFLGLAFTMMLFTGMFIALLPAAAVIQNILLAFIFPWYYCSLYVAFARATLPAREMETEEEAKDEDIA